MFALCLQFIALALCCAYCPTRILKIAVAYVGAQFSPRYVAKSDARSTALYKYGSANVVKLLSASTCVFWFYGTYFAPHTVADWCK